MLDTENDTCLWDGSGLDSRGNRPTRWLELYVHEGKGGHTFYLIHRTQWQGETSYIESISLDDAQRFAEEHADDMLNDIGEQRLKELGLLDLEGID